MIVVSNSSPLIALARIGPLNLLATLYRRILIPPEVRHEVTVAGRASLRLPADPAIERACRALGAGERGAILLAKATNADLTLLDESKARRIARDAGLSVVGCIGLLKAG